MIKDNVSQVYIRPLEQGDVENCLKWHNDPSLYSSLCNPFRQVSRVAEETWLSTRIKYSDKEVNSAICLNKSATHIGNIYLRDINWGSQNAAVGLFIGEASERGKGYGTAALKLMTDHAFHDLGLHRVYLYALATNVAAVKSYQRVGFSNEGTLRDHVFKQGRFHDVVVLGLRRCDFQPKTSPTSC